MILYYGRGYRKKLLRQQVLKNQYRKHQIKIGPTTSKKFKTSNGLLQGNPLSQIHLKIYADICLREWTKKCNRMSTELKETFLNICFLQMAKQFTQDDEVANYKSNHLHRDYRKWGFQINFSKTEYMTKDPDELSIVGIKIK